MSTAIGRRTVAIAAWVALVIAATPALAQDTLARAKDYYASASYEEALQVLEHLRPTAPASDALEVSAYQVFCLVALGRQDEAKVAVEALVRAAPLYRPSDDQASPRVRAFFDTVRRPLLPDLAKASYTLAKDAFNRKDLKVAAAGFDRTVAIIDELKPAPSDAADLRTLASGFRDLTTAALAAEAAAAAAKPAASPGEGRSGGAPSTPAAAPPPPRVPDGPHVYSASDADVTKPIAISRELPKWVPVDAFEARQQYQGVLELLIGEDGKVISASLVKSVQIRYDPLLLRAAAAWTFRPATKNGEPVRYRFLMDVRLSR